MKLLGVVCFGEPRPGFVQLADVLGPYPNRSYRNNPVGQPGHDFVTDEPPRTPLLYVHGGECSINPRHLIDIDGPPTDALDWTFFRWHHIPLYQVGMRKLQNVGTTSGVSDIDCCDLCSDLYDDSKVTGWDHYDPGTDDGIVWAARKVNGVWVVVNRGSKTPQDFWRDVQGWYVTLPKLGPIEAGFARGSSQQAFEVATLVGDDPVLFTGHSLGAARGQIQAGYAVTHAYPVVAHRD